MTKGLGVCPSDLRPVVHRKAVVGRHGRDRPIGQLNRGQVQGQFRSRAI